MPVLAALGWPGSKNGRHAVGRWVAGKLPPVAADQIYIEPFAGMLGCLLQRPPAQCEIVNDLNGHLLAWWTAVRDHPQELARLLDATPKSRQQYNDCRDLLARIETGEEAVSPARHGWAAAVVVTQSHAHNLQLNSGWHQNHNPHPQQNPARRVLLLADRVRNVMLENRPGEELVEAWAPRPQAVIYCDPPYPSAAAVYSHTAVDADRMLDAFRGAQAKIAVSGYPADPWTALEDHGWRRFTMCTVSKMGDRRGRREVLWANYDPPGQQTLPVG